MINKSQDIGYFLEEEKWEWSGRDTLEDFYFFSNFLLWKISQIQKKLKE